MFEKVLVAVDGSSHAEKALKAGGELARLGDGEVRVLHVREVYMFPRGGDSSEEDRQQAADLVEGAVERLRVKGVKASGATRAAINGRVAREILDEAREWGATTLVMASRGLTDLSGIVLGSTTHKVLHLTDLPVLVVR